MHKVKNHGSFLQAYALMSVVRSISDADVEFIDFDSRDGIKDPCKETYLRMRRSKLKYFMISCGAALTRIPVFGRIFARNRRLRTWSNMLSFLKLYSTRYEREFWNELPFSNELLSDADVDMLIIGSDEVFNCKINSSVGYSDDLFGAGSKTDNIISFSASFGNTTKNDIADDTKGKLCRYLSRFKSISVRDRNSLENIRCILGEGARAEYHLDPVFHYDFEKEMPQIKRKKPYLAVYAYNGLDKDVSRAVKKYARERGLDVICLLGYQADLGEYVSASPFETLAYMKGAECVFTNTFHGVVIATKFNKRFCVMLAKGSGYSNVDKLGDLIDRLSLDGRVLTDAEKIASTLDEKIDFTYANNYISETTRAGINYLRKNIAEI